MSRVAWTSGVVVATCRGCGARHLLADNEARLDVGNDTGFRNIVEVIEQRGEKVLKLSGADADALRELNMTVDEDGRFRLLDDDGGALPASPVSEDVPEAAPAPAPEAATPAPQAASPASQGTEAAPDAQQQLPSGASEEEIDEAPLVMPMPRGCQAGDVITASTDFGIMHIPVPRDAFQGCRLEVQGMVEVGLGPGYDRWILTDAGAEWTKTDAWSVGDITAINMPEGEVVRIKIPESAAEDATLRIAYPVAVLPEVR